MRQARIAACSHPRSGIEKIVVHERRDPIFEVCTVCGATLPLDDDGNSDD